MAGDERPVAARRLRDGRAARRAGRRAVIAGRAGYLEHRELADAESEPRLQRLYEWSAVELAKPRLLELARAANPVYAWPFEQRHVWRKSQMPLAARLLERATRAR